MLWNGYKINKHIRRGKDDEPNHINKMIRGKKMLRGEKVPQISP